MGVYAVKAELRGEIAGRAANRVRILSPYGDAVNLWGNTITCFNFNALEAYNRICKSEDNGGAISSLGEIIGTANSGHVMPRSGSFHAMHCSCSLE